MTVLKICIGDWSNASRDQRELAVCRELGAEVAVIAKGNREDYGRVEDVNGFRIYRMTTRPFRHLPLSVNRVLSIFIWAWYARRLQADIISGHDIGGLMIGWISAFFLFGKRKPKLIYDSHEFELGRNEIRSRFTTLCVGLLEHFLINRSYFTIVVNDSIAEELKRIHHIKRSPLAVRNIPYEWQVDDDVCTLTRKALLEKMRASEGTVLMYHGALMCGRGIERCIDMLARDDDLRLIVLGNDAGNTYLNELKDRTEFLHVSARVLFHPAVPQQELWKYVGAADISMVVIEPRVKSYYLSLPNKLFEAIQAHTPVIGSKLPEISRIIEKYQVGEVCDPENDDDIYNAIRRIKTDRALWRSYKENEIAASKVLNWEKESRILKRAYRRAMRTCAE